MTDEQIKEINEANAIFTLDMHECARMANALTILSKKSDRDYEDAAMLSNLQHDESA